MKTLQRFSAVVSVITLIAFFTGCAETKDGRATQAQGTAIGTVLGAGLGAGIGYLAGGSQGAVAGAIIGGVAGGSLGFAYGTNVARQKAKYANAEMWLNDCIASAKQANHKAYAYNDSLSKKVAALDARTKAAIASNNKAELRNINAEAASLQKQATNEHQQINTYIQAQSNVTGDKSARSSANYAAYKSELVDLDKSDAGISKNLSRLASIEKQTNL